ncbi:sugar transporter [Penicillium cinerascens]|uniref:Sugar transporter n=1 Tax=Penicillium cinerascens TaxID=70096 RepID=A0A9W9M5V8_9EURO|nr:sugar transporter [Penicillium cinerascens]KAJ5190871.1 sugar transporter [Penicillium cinerascens]
MPEDSIQDDKPTGLDLTAGEVVHIENEEKLGVDTEHGAYPPGNQYEHVLEAHKVNYLGKGYLKLYLACLLVYLNSTMKGYDASMMASVNVLPSYLAYFNLKDAPASSSIVFAIFQVGQIASCFFYWTMDVFGRKLVLFVSCIGVIACIIIQGTAVKLSVFIGGRFLGSVFSTTASLTSVVYLVEIAPPLYRGAVAGTFNTLYYMGALIASFAAYGATIHYDSSSNITWKLPTYLQILCPAIMAMFVYFIPESPRWLAMRNREEEARAIIVKYHANGDPDHPAVELEMEEIKHSLMLTREEEGTRPWEIALDFRKLFVTRARRYRTILAGSMGWVGEFCGSNIASYYLPEMAKAVGITDTNTLLLLTAMYFVVAWIAAIIGANLHDRFGRRKIMTTAMGCLTAVFAVMAVTTAEFQRTGNKAASYTMLTFIFLFGITFSFAFTPMQQVYPAEVMDNQMRARGIAFFGVNSGIAAFTSVMIAQIALDSISYNFYTFYCVWDFVLLLVIFFFFVETKERTLEELDWIFEAKNPRKASTAKM